MTFANLFENSATDAKSGKTKVMKIDRSILQRLLIARKAGRKVDTEEILQHELFNVPLSLAKTNGDIYTGDKACLIEKLSSDANVPPANILPDSPADSQLIIDGQAFIVAIGKPKEASNFGDLPETFKESVIGAGSKFDRIHIVFDRYESKSIKNLTRKKKK